jgi:hypothetical protein
MEQAKLICLIITTKQKEFYLHSRSSSLFDFIPITVELRPKFEHKIQEQPLNESKRKTGFFILNSERSLLGSKEWIQDW